MDTNIYNLTLDIDKGTSIINYPVTIRKGEGTSNVIRAKLMSHGVALKLSKTDPIAFYCLKPDNHVVLTDPATVIDVENSIIEYPISSQVGAVSGHIEIAYFKVGDRYTSNNFSIDVKDDVDSNLKSSDYIPVLNDLMKIWQDQIEEIQTKLHEVKDWADDEENKIAETLNGYLIDLTASTDKWVSNFENKYTSDFDKLLQDFKTDYETWKQSVDIEIEKLTSQVPALSSKLEDIKTQIDNLNIEDLTGRLSTIENDITEIKANYALKTDVDTNVSALNSRIDSLLELINFSKWGEMKFDVTLQNGYTLYGTDKNFYYFKDELNVIGEQIRTVVMRFIVTNTNGTKNNDIPLLLPNDAIPTVQQSIIVGGSGTDLMKYDINTDGTIKVHGTTASTTNKKPWMIITGQYTFIIPKDDSRYKARDLLDGLS